MRELIRKKNSETDNNARMVAGFAWDWSDDVFDYEGVIIGNDLIVASSKESNIIGPTKDFDKRSIAGKRRKLAQTKAPEIMLHLLDTAVSNGISADYVLFDCWFANPAQITAVKSKGMDALMASLS